MKRYTVHGDKDKEEMIVYLFFCIVYRVPCTVSFLRLCVYFAERRDVFKAFSLRLDKGGNVLRKGDVFKASFLRLDKGENAFAGRRRFQGEYALKTYVFTLCPALRKTP